MAWGMPFPQLAQIIERERIVYVEVEIAVPVEVIRTVERPLESYRAWELFTAWARVLWLRVKESKWLAR